MAAPLKAIGIGIKSTIRGAYDGKGAYAGNGDGGEVRVARGEGFKGEDAKIVHWDLALEAGLEDGKVDGSVGGDWGGRGCHWGCGGAVENAGERGKGGSHACERVS